MPRQSTGPKLTDAQRKELDLRLEAYRRNPRAGSTWEVVKRRIETKLRRQNADKPTRK